MKERPILMNGDMVRAILDGRKTQTRRMIKPQPDTDGIYPDEYVKVAWIEGFINVECPYGKVGDRLWVKEEAFFMPRWASRIDLEITDIRVERVQDITEEGAKAEGLQDYKERFNIKRSGSITWYARYAFVTLWNRIYGKDAFLKNPWTWVVEFKEVSK